jgi:polyribonucleotide nucleotidyltransferase
MPAVKVEAKIGDRAMVIETGRLAEQAGGAVTVRYGDTVVLATATASKAPREGIDFFPLTVDFEERLYAAGKIPGSFPRREGRPSEYGILTARLTDRPLRPLFPKGFRNDVQIIVTPLSADQENDPDVLAVNAASAALSISDVPFDGPVGCVRVGSVDGRFVANPTIQQLEQSALDLVVAGTRDAIMMVEAGAQQVGEALLIEALEFAQEWIANSIRAQESLAKMAGKPKMAFVPAALASDKASRINSFLADRIRHAVRNPDKAAREEATDAAEIEAIAALASEGSDITPSEVTKAFDEALKNEVRSAIIAEGIRPDGRRLDEIRPISIEVGILPRAHGSGLFKRGQTQALSIATLGPAGDEQIIDTLEPVETKRYLHHYNFPPYSTGETRPLRGAGRREIGHGALAERALLPVVPTKEEFPYTIRVVSEILSSNGSTSMASTCGSTLALMDAGVPIKAPIGGVAMGLVMENGRYAILTDIQGIEDALGDMDFKVAGSSKGVTALQMDIKVKGITIQIMREALEQARKGRLFILERMGEVLSASRSELSPFAPRIDVMKIHPDRIRDIIGPGGKMIRQIQSESGTEIEVEDDGTVRIAGVKPEGREKAKQMVLGLTKEVQLGEIYTGKVTRIMGLGAFVEILPGKEGLVKPTELSSRGRPPRIEDEVNIGDEVTVKVVEVDRQGRINLSIRAVHEEGNGYAERQREEADRYADRPRRDFARSGGHGERRGPPRRGPR